MRRIKGFGIIILIVILAGCINQTMYHSYHHIPQDEGWSNNDTISLDISVLDTLKLYQIYFLVRNNTDYPYRNFSASVTYNLPDTTVWVTDTLEMMLATKEGKWLGSGWAGLYQTALLLKENTISHPANLTFKIKHLVEDSNLKGITDIGIQAKTTE